MGRPPPYLPDRGNKYNAKRTVCHQGHSHPSKREAGRCDELHLLQACGQITGLKWEPQYWFTIHGIQVKHDNGRRVGFKPDFSYLEMGRQVVEESKPARVQARARDYPIRKALFKALYPEVDFREVA